MWYGLARVSLGDNKNWPHQFENKWKWNAIFVDANFRSGRFATLVGDKERCAIFNKCKKRWQQRQLDVVVVIVIIVIWRRSNVTGWRVHHLERLGTRNSGRHEVHAWTPWHSDALANCFGCSPDDWVNWVRRFDKIRFEFGSHTTGAWLVSGLWSHQKIFNLRPISSSLSVWMDGWMDGWMKGWMEGWVDAGASSRVLQSPSCQFRSWLRNYYAQYQFVRTYRANGKFPQRAD